MYKIFKLIFISILFSKNLTANSCVNMINIYNQADYPKTIIGQKGYEKQIKRYSIKEKEFLFWEILENTDKVKFKFIDKKCYELYFILKEQNFSAKAKKISFFRQKVFTQYRNKLKKQKITIKTIDGCHKFASNYFRSFLNMNINNFKKNSVLKRQYQRCLEINSRKKRR